MPRKNARPAERKYREKALAKKAADKAAMKQAHREFYALGNARLALMAMQIMKGKR